MNASLSRFAWNLWSDPFPLFPRSFLPQAKTAENTAIAQTTKDYAQLQHARVLLNCYAREVAMQEHNLAVRALAHTRLPPAALEHYQGQVLDIQVPRMRSRFCVGVKHVSVTGNYDYITDIYLQDQRHIWSIASWRDIAQIIVADLSLREKTEFNSDLLQQIEESIATMQHLLEAQQGKAMPSHTTQPLRQYIHSEQHLLTGHPFHPTPKSRSGWTRLEEKNYSPEHGAQLQLHYFQLPRAWIISDSLDAQDVARSLQQLTEHHWHAPHDHIVVPVHPWQANWLLQQACIKAAIATGEIRHLGSSGKQFYPTASIRTMLAEDGGAFLKLSLNLRITNCVRNNARHELAAALTASRLYRQMKEEVLALFPHFHALEEQAYLSVALPSASQSNDQRGDQPSDQPSNQSDQPQAERPHKEIEDGFGLVLREGLGHHIKQGITPMICAALFGNGQSGRLHVASLIERYSHRRSLSLSQGIRLWFDSYAELAIYPLFYLLFEKGIVLEPHMQNSIVGLSEDGAPVSFIVRDLELTRLTPKAHQRLSVLQLDQQTHKEICCSDEAGWTRIAYCLLVNNICEVIATLANGNHALYLDLWACLRNTLQSYLARFPSAEATRRIQGLLSGEPLPVKGNLLIRFLKQADRKAAYLPLYHPLGVVNGSPTSI